MNTLSIDDVITIYEHGNYKVAKILFKKLYENVNEVNVNVLIESPTSRSHNSLINTILDLNDINKIKAYLLAMCEYNHVKYYDLEKTNADSFYNFINVGITQSNEICLIILALWHINNSFPTILTNLFSYQNKNKDIGIEILKNLSSKSSHTCFILSEYYLSNENDLTLGNEYLKRSAILNNMEAQYKLNNVGINWNDNDQFFDHARCWCLFPNSFPHTIQSCIGCGRINDGTGWVQCNCCLCGFHTSENCSSIVSYFNDCFINTLRSFDHPIRLFSTLTAIATSGLTSIGGVYAPYGLVLSYVTTGLTTLSLFIRKEITF